MIHCGKYTRRQVFSDPNFSLIQKNSGQRKPVFRHVLGSDYTYIYTYIYIFIYIYIHIYMYTYTYIQCISNDTPIYRIYSRSSILLHVMQPLMV